MANETITDQTAIDALADGDFLLADDLSDSSVSKKVSGTQISTYVGTKNLSNLSNASTARTNLGVAIGTDVLAEQTIGIADNNLLEVDGTPNAAEYARFTANGLEGRTEAEFKADFNLEIGTDVQAYDAELAAIAGLTSAADKLPYFTGSGTAAVTDLTSEARTSLGDVSLTLQKATATLSSAQILALHTTPVTVLAAQGANKVILLSHIYAKYNYGTAAYAGIATNENLLFRTGSLAATVGMETIGFIDQTSDQERLAPASSPFAIGSIELEANSGIEAYLTGAITTGDGTIDLTIFYYILDNS